MLYSRWKTLNHAAVIPNTSTLESWQHCGALRLTVYCPSELRKRLISYPTSQYRPSGAGVVGPAMAGPIIIS